MRSMAVVLLLLIRFFIVARIVGFCYCFIICRALLCVHSSVALILMRKRELVTSLCFVFHVTRVCCVVFPRGTTGLSAVLN